MKRLHFSFGKTHPQLSLEQLHSSGPLAAGNRQEAIEANLVRDESGGQVAGIEKVSVSYQVLIILSPVHKCPLGYRWF